MTARRGEPLGPLKADEQSLQLLDAGREELESRLTLLAKHGALGDTANLNARVRAAAARMALQIQNRGKSATKEAKMGFILALSAGLSVQAASALLGVPELAFRRERQRDDDFAREWELALEASSEPLEQRLESIAWALPPEKAGPAQVRAAALVLAGKNARYQRRAQATFTARDEDGHVRRIEWLQNDGLTPD